MAEQGAETAQVAEGFCPRCYAIEDEACVHPDGTTCEDYAIRHPMPPERVVDDERFCPSCLAGMESSEHLLACVPDENCNRCGGPNVIWSAASPLWNLVMRGNDINGEPRYGDLVCMPCFILCAVEAGLPAHGWRLTLNPEPEGLIHETPSGRVWDADRFLWVAP